MKTSIKSKTRHFIRWRMCDQLAKVNISGSVCLTFHDTFHLTHQGKGNDLNTAKDHHSSPNQSQISLVQNLTHDRVSSNHLWLFHITQQTSWWEHFTRFSKKICSFVAYFCTRWLICHIASRNLLNQKEKGVWQSAGRKCIDVMHQSCLQKQASSLF